jgi:thiamine-phosphate pyrophosphorylase
MHVPPLYCIVDVDLCRARGLDADAVAEAMLRGGARLIQVRDKGSGAGDMLARVDRLVALARPRDALVIVNDRADVAWLAGAAGVHVGQDDLQPSHVRRIAGDRLAIGLSTHTPAQIDAAAGEPVDYIAVGPVFGTATKHTGYDPVGLDSIRNARAHTTLPIVAIGGITIHTAAEVLAAGASAVAVISDLLVSDPERRVRQYLAELGKTV